MGKVWFDEFAGISLNFAALNIISPRIINANFAQKHVTAGTGTTPATDPTVGLRAITEGIIGRKVFIAVETENMQGDDITIELVRHDDGTNDVLSVTNGTADVASFTATVGDTTALEDINGNNPYGNPGDFEDMAIFKVDFRPNSRADFDTWAQQINTATAPEIKVRVKPADSGAFVKYNSTGNDTSHTHPDGFIFGQYDIENKSVYEIYHVDNTFNFNPNFNDYGNAQRRRPISKLVNDFTNAVGYIYIDLDDNEHEVCESEIFDAVEKDRDQIPANYNQAQTAFEDILLRLNPNPNNPATNIQIFTNDAQQVNDALVQNSLTETPANLFQMLVDYRNLLNGGLTDAQIVTNLNAQAQNVQAFMNNSTAAQRASMLIIDNVLDQTSYALEGVDARFTCEYALGVVTSGDTSQTLRRRYYRNMNITTPIKLIDAQFEALINLPSKTANQPALNYNSGSLTIAFNYRASRRRYANPDVFAGFIGALAQLNYVHSAAEVISSGFSFQDGSCYPSSTHVNGVACDTMYFNQVGQLELYQQPFIDALWDYGIYDHLMGDNTTLFPTVYNHARRLARHNDHLHSYRFNHNNRNFVHALNP